MRGLILKEEFAQKIAHGKKIEEYRNFPTKKMNEKIAIISGDRIYAYVKITKVVELSCNEEYKYAWALHVMDRFPVPETRPRCKRKKGQQVWAIIE